jgi:hypothetical protein
MYLNLGVSGYYIDKIRTGFLAWTPSVKAYKVIGKTSGLTWETSSQECLRVIGENVTRNGYFQRLSLLWSQESSKTSGRIELRSENMAYIKSLGQIYHIDVRYRLIVHLQSRCLNIKDSTTFLPLSILCYRTRTSSSNAQVRRY